MMSSPFMQEAVGLWNQGKLEEAVAASSRMLAQQPVAADALVFHAGLLLHLRRFPEARDVLLEASAEYPHHAPLLSNLSVAHRNCGQPTLAIATAQKALTHAPELLAGWNALLLALLAAGQEVRARSELNQALALHPDAPSLRHLEIQLNDQADGSAGSATEQVVRSLISQANAHVAAGALGSAEAAYRQLIAIEPHNPYGHAGLGELLLVNRKPEEAAEHLSATLRELPGHARARHLLAVAKGKPPPVAAADYVRSLFDGMAETFDHHLKGRLAYRVPEELTECLSQVAQANFGDVLDLGCGTGLVGECLAARSRSVDGVDLSPEMLRRARGKNVYRELYLAEIGQFLSLHEKSWQMITAADVFIYHGQLDQLFKQICRALRPGGVVGFSVEATAAAGFDVDKASGRYRHSRTYLESVGQAAGLRGFRFLETTIRKESGLPIEGWIVVARNGV